MNLSKNSFRNKLRRKKLSHVLLLAKQRELGMGNLLDAEELSDQNGYAGYKIKSC